MKKPYKLQVGDTAGRAIPDNNLAYPVFVELDTGFKGSGFFLNTDTNTYFVTAGHVLFDETTGNLRGKKATLLSYSEDRKEMKRNVSELDLPNLLASKNIRRHATEDIVVVCIADVIGKNDDGRTIMKMVSGLTNKETAPLGSIGVALDSIKQFEDVLIGNTVYLFGYPTSLGIKSHPQIDPLRPLLRIGIVAGTNPTQKTIILDCPVYGGNSGGPVLEVEGKSLGSRRFRVIGVVTEFVPFTETWVNTRDGNKNVTISNSGYSVAVSMDLVLELVNSP